MIVDEAILLGFWLTLISVGTVGLLSYQAARLRRATDARLEAIARELKRRAAPTK